jgi:hypothetical protein
VYGVSQEFSIDGGRRSIYGVSKLIADAARSIAQPFDLPILVNRFGVISGVGNSVMPTKDGWFGELSRTGLVFR